ncbi:MAG TPA: hypothetical protein VGC97_21735 [Pyrinomonadaceae bacterium]|jgi:hypothetical protein
MSGNIFLFLFICLLGLQIGCQTGQATSAGTLNLPITEDTISDDDIQELFIDSGLGEDDGNFKKLMALPRERVVEIVQKLKDNGIRQAERGYQSENQSDDLKLKSAYFLWKLGVNADENEKYIVEATKSKESSLRLEAIGWLCVIAGNGKAEHLPVILKSTPQADGFYAEGLQGFFIGELLSEPKVFLLYLSKEDLKVRRSVYELIASTDEMWGQEKMDKVNTAVRALKDDKETEKIVEEFLREVRKRQ